MRTILFTLVLIFTASASVAVAQEVVVFTKSSRYRGAALQVAKVELDKHGRLLLTGAHGELFSASPDDVDWELSRRMTERLQSTQLEAKTRQLEADRKRMARKEIASDTQLSVLEASMLYGVDKPALSVPEGSAYRQSTSPGATPAEAVPTNIEITETAAMKKLATRIEALQNQRDAVAADLAKLNADSNPDPLSASLRTSRIEEKQGQLATLDKQLGELKADLDRLTAEARAAAVEKARAEAAAAATPTPAPTPAPSPTPDPNPPPESI